MGLFSTGVNCETKKACLSLRCFPVFRTSRIRTTAATANQEYKFNASQCGNLEHCHRSLTSLAYRSMCEGNTLNCLQVKVMPQAALFVQKWNNVLYRLNCPGREDNAFSRPICLIAWPTWTARSSQSMRLPTYCPQIDLHIPCVYNGSLSLNKT